MLNLPEETVFGNLKEGLDLLTKERAVIHTMTGMLKGYFRANPFHQQNLKVFARGRAEFYTLIIPFNSPLKPILQKACSELQEAGTMDYLVSVWEGKDIPTVSAVELMILTPGQVILVFCVVALCFSFSFLVFCCEIVHKKMKAVKNQRQMRKSTKRKGKKIVKITPEEFLRSQQSKWGDFYSETNGSPDASKHYTYL